MAIQAAAHQGQRPVERYSATFDYLIFSNPENGYCVVRMKTMDSNVPPQARDTHYHGDKMIRFTAFGYGIPQNPGVEVLLEGHWECQQYGHQLKVENWREDVPRTIEGVRSYLCCGLLKGIGANTADAIVQRFGVKALEILEQKPDELLQIKGITERKLEEIKASYQESRDLQELMLYLAPFDVSPKTALRIQKFFGPRSATIIQEEPFSLCKISGFGFKRVDIIARKTGCKLDAPLRIRGALFYTLQEVQREQGHLFLAADVLSQQALLLLNTGIVPHMQLGLRTVADELYECIVLGELVMDQNAIYLPKTFLREDEMAKKIAEIIGRGSCGVDVSLVLEQVAKEMGFPPSEKQLAGVKKAFLHDLSIITGPPGAGKTTVLKAAVKVFRKLNPEGALLLCAPTGRASRRMAESTGVSAACTLHKALGILGGDESGYFTRGASKVSCADFIIVDEFSMTDITLAYELFKEVRRGTRILLVGDADQLPSVGPGNVFHELISCGQIPVTVLDEIFRQKMGSNIIINGRRINNGITKLEEGRDFTFIESPNPEQAAAKIRELFMESAAEADTQVLSPFKVDGEASAYRLSESIRDMVNPASPDKPEIKIGNRLFRVNDKVMQTVNTANVSNGDIGIVRAINRGTGERLTVTIDFPSLCVVNYSTSQMSAVDLAYAVTVHKAMGSEYGVVIIPVLMAHAILLYRRILYTAVTRARERIFLVGQRRALFMAIHKVGVERNTLLGKRIAGYMQGTNRAAS